MYEIEKDESDEPTSHSDYKIFIETINIENSAYINQIKNENSDWSVTLPSNEIPVSYKIDTRAQCNAIPLTNFKKFDPEHNLCPVNIKFYANNNAKTPALGKCSLTLQHKKDSLNVSYPYRGWNKFFIVWPDIFSADKNHIPVQLLQLRVLVVQ